jgi:hypothetical protein
MLNQFAAGQSLRRIISSLLCGMRTPPTRDQWDWLHEQSGRVYRNFRRILMRLEMRGFYQTDPMHKAVARVMDAAGSLSIHYHYLTIPGGVGGANELAAEADPMLWVGDGI